MTQAGLEASDGEYDYAIWGDGMFMLRHPTDGEITYTRNGRFSLSSRQDGFYLASDSGCLVLDENQQPIKLEDGVLSALPGIFKAENTDGILSVGNSEYQFRAKNGQVTLATDSQLMEGYLELSNVDLTAEFTGLIEAQRAYGFALKMVQTSDEVEQTIVNLR
jgi:flagellar basal-body rod protein FlgG